MSRRRNGHTDLTGDVRALCNAMIGTVCGKNPPATDFALAPVIARHGWDALLDELTGLVLRTLACVAAERVPPTSPQNVFDEYAELLYKDAADVGALARVQLLEHGRPPVPDPETRDVFIWSLVTLHVAGVIELAGHRTKPRTKKNKRHTRRTRR